MQPSAEPLPLAATPRLSAPVSARAHETSTPVRLAPLFRLAAAAPALARSLGPLATWLVPLLSPAVRRGTTANATAIFGRRLAAPEQRRFTRDVAGSFVSFILEVCRSSRETPDALLARIDAVVGEQAYRQARRDGRGAVLVTAHLGSFELGLAALRRVEPRVHVVYKRDAAHAFEAMRAGLRRRLGVIEAPIDAGLPTWLGLREALLRGEAVVMQADRAMPGQHSEVVPFLHGRLRVPTGPVRLARLTRSLIVPVFTIRKPSGRFEIRILPPIEPGVEPGRPGPDPAVAAVAQAIESIVSLHPTQWLMLGAAFEEAPGLE